MIGTSNKSVPVAWPLSSGFTGSPGPGLPTWRTPASQAWQRHGDEGETVVSSILL